MKRSAGVARFLAWRERVLALNGATRDVRALQADLSIVVLVDEPISLDKIADTVAAALRRGSDWQQETPPWQRLGSHAAHAPSCNWKPPDWR